MLMLHVHLTTLVATPHRGDEDVSHLVGILVIMRLLPLTGAMRTGTGLGNRPASVATPHRGDEDRHRTGQPTRKRCYPSQGR